MSARLKPLAWRLRRNQTPAERRVWRAINARQIEGFGFRRQVELHGYIVDFACYEARLIVEIDGATHSTDRELERDARRGEILRANGNAILRFANDEVFRNPDAVLETIRLKLRELRPRDDDAIPSPLVGEG